MMAATYRCAPDQRRMGDEHPEFCTSPSELMTAVVGATKELDADVGEGNIAVVVPDAMFEAVSPAPTPRESNMARRHKRVSRWE